MFYPCVLTTLGNASDIEEVAVKTSDHLSELPKQWEQYEPETTFLSNLSIVTDNLTVKES